MRVVCPACAGMILDEFEDDPRRVRLPRMCGDDPFKNDRFTLRDVFAPHVRG